MTMDNSKKSNGEPTKKWSRTKRILGYTGLVLVVIAGAGGGYSTYEYHHLQPTSYFKKGIRPVIGSTYTPQENGTFNLLLIGSDARAGETAGHSDSMILIHANLNTYQFYMVSIPRDTRAYFPGYGYTKLTSIQYMDQAAHGLQQGTVDAVEAISQQVGVSINYYAETNFSGIQNIVNSLGGITMDLPFPVKITMAWYPQDQGDSFPAGPNFVNGEQAFELTHTRDGLPGTDYGRQRLQEAALVGIAKRVMSPSEVTNLPQILKSLRGYLTATNVSFQTVLSIGLAMRGHFNVTTDIHYTQIPETPETIYNSVLQAFDDELVISKSAMQQLIKKDFS